VVAAVLAAADPCAGARDLRAAAEAIDKGELARADYLSSLALAVAPDCSEALVVQGRVLALKGRPREARDALEKAVRLAPRSAEARYQLGIWLYRALLYPDAVQQVEKVVALRPGDARAHDYLALSLEALGQAERADRAYQDALKANAGPSPDTFFDYYYGRFLLKQNRLEESHDHLDRAVALHPDERTVHYERGKLNLALMDYAAARRDAERALSLRDPAGAVAVVKASYLHATDYAGLGETEIARRYAELSRVTPVK